ncbi:autotransporter outer membrane beta-barrel domain-containing protein [Budvicia diplopodorum]|uniref:autotransporter family protein n=1 Tax=Budvicia diplopodorum TaxID=1119056 RepID=UPI00135BA70A|nr:autotransporter outer membrane beta-barrel domain-containing protein [Budvicia diplopodorum]
MSKQWKKILPMVLGGSFFGIPLVEAAELTNQTYTNTMTTITNGNYTVSNGDVTIDASGFVRGYYGNDRSLINTYNGAVNVNISEGKTLTLRGSNGKYNASEHASTLYAVKQGSLSGTMSFTGGNIVVSNEITNYDDNFYAMFAGPGGKFDFKSDGDNKVNLTVYMPPLGPTRSGHRYGIGLQNAQLVFDGGNFIVNVPGDPGGEAIMARRGLVLSGGSTADIKADRILIEANETALEFSDFYEFPGIYDAVNTAKFEADSIVLKGNQGIFAAGGGTYRNRNTIEFTGETLIEAIGLSSGADEYGENFFGYSIGGRAIEVEQTDITFNNRATIIGENLTPQGTRPGYMQDPGDPFEEWIDPYWLKTISLVNGSTLVANDEFSLTSNGGYYNTGLYVWKSSAQFNGKTDITVKNGVDTARAMYIYDDFDGTTKATFEDDLKISLAGTNADYISGIEVAYGGKAEVKKGLILNDNSNITWALYSRGADSQIDINTSGTGTVQVVGEVGASNSGVLNMTLNNANSYLTAASYTLSADSPNRGTVNLDISNRAIWNMTGTSSVTNLTLDQGTVNFLPPSNSGAFKNLIVRGNYNGGGTLIINTALGDDSSATDKLIVAGDTSGTTGVIVNNHNGTGGLTANGIEVIRVAGRSDGIFTLNNRVVAGAYEYQLAQGSVSSPNNGGWYLRSSLMPVPPPTPTPTPTPDEPVDPDTPVTPVTPVTPITPVIRPEAGSYMANIAAASKLFNLRLEDREGRAENSSMWLRQQGSRTKFRDSSGQIKTATNTYVVQGGGEVAQTQFSDTDRLGVGLMLGYGKSDSESGNHHTGYNSKGKVDGYSGGVYATWYQDAKTLNGLYVDSWVQYSMLNAEVNGEQLSGESYDMNGLSASVESGYRIPVYQGESGHVFVTPQAQIIWSNIQADDHREANGTQVKSDNNNNVQTRLGMKLSRDGTSDIDSAKDRLFTTYLEANWLHNTEQASTTMDGVTISQSGYTNAGELKLGVEGQLNKNVNLWTNIAQQMGDNGYSDTLATVGLKYSF